MIEQLATAAALSVLNRMLAREAWARERLAPFAGRVARFEAPPFALAFRITEGGVFADAERAEPTVTVGADLAALPRALGDPQAVLRNVSLKGDADFAQSLGFVLQNLRPEPEEELSRFIGDAAAQRLVALRDAWLNPPNPAEAELKKRTLTNLYNQRPDWLAA